jgi:hypothetical protein
MRETTASRAMMLSAMRRQQQRLEVMVTSQLEMRARMDAPLPLATASDARLTEATQRRN